MIKATKVDGIYDKDPMKHADAKKYDSISYESVIEQNLKILDQTAVSLAKENNQVLQVLKLEDRETLLSAIN
jgi:uridylate kinase